MNNREAILGIDTSCYTTSCAIASLDGQVLSNVRIPLVVTLGERGLRQSEAVFQHVKQLPQAIREAMSISGKPRIRAVCASGAPTHQAESYMPVFLAGLSFAKSIAEVMDVPCYVTSHQQGHFAAATIGLEDLPETHLGMHLSGGTTEIVHVSGESLTRLGGSLDISAGQLIDRVGVAMGLPFPAGPSLEKLACDVKTEGRYPAIVKHGVDCSLSGAEAAAFRDISSGLGKGVIAAEVFDCIARTVMKMAVAASENTGINEVLITGGVASSSLLKDVLGKRAKKRGMSINLLFGQAQYAADNAAGVAVIGLKHYQK